jgi:hypothetical protein
MTYDRFGGWTGLRGKRTGWFHVERLRGRWWLVSPEGHAFFSKGVCCVSFQGDDAPSLGYSPYEKHAVAKFGTIERWAPNTVKRLRDLGFNTLGTWSNLRLSRYGIAHAPILNLAAESVRGLWLKGGFPDVFSADFRAGVERAAARMCDRFRDDPWLLGYFTDNELHWEPDWRSPESLLKMFLKFSPRSAGRQFAELFVDIQTRRRPKKKLTSHDEEIFLEVVAAEYFNICRQAIRRRDPNHLVLGCRFAGRAPAAVLRAMTPYIDIVSFNTYEHKAPLGALRRFYRMTNKPVMLTEFSFKAKDSGLPNTKGGGKPVATQRDRAKLFERFVTSLAKMRECIGYHWFKYADQPKQGRFDGEDNNYGLVRIDDTPWEVLTEKMREVNAGLEKRHAAR